jgi:MFS family permease
MPENTQVFLEFLSFIGIGLIIWKYIFGFISDIFGRKKLIVLNTFLCGLSTIGLAIFTSNLIYISQVTLDISNFTLPKHEYFY